MAFVCWAVRGVSIDDVIARALEPAGLVRDPRWIDILDFEELPACCFSAGDWTFALLHGAEDGLDAAFADFDGEVMRLVRSDFDWSTVAGLHRGEQVWSIHGDSEHDFLRPEGTVPALPELASFFEQDSDLERVPAEIARVLAGVLVEDDDVRPRPIRIVRLDHAPIALEEPSLAALSAIETTARGQFLFDLAIDGGEADWMAAERGPDRLLLVSRNAAPISVDTSVFPPVFTPIGPDAWSCASPTPWGSTLVATIDDRENTLLRELGGAHPQSIGLPFATLGIYGALRPVAAGVVAIPAAYSEGDRVPCLISANGARRVVTRIPVPPSPEERREVEPLVAGFADGSFLLVWDGQAYRWNRGALAHLGPLLADGLHRDQAVTATDGTILGAFDDALVELYPDGARIPLAGFIQPTRVVPALGNSAIVEDRDPSARAKIWWLSHPSITRLPTEWFPGEDYIFYVDARRDLLVGIGTTTIEAVPWEDIAALPRTTV